MRANGTAAASSGRVEQVLDLVRARGGRVTTARRYLLEALFDSEGHRTAEDLAQVVHGRMPDVHISTIYRNLDELERLGVIVHTHLGHGPASYHLASSPHGHLVCESCGATLEAPAEMFAGLARSARRRYGFRIDPRHFAVLGACAACSDLLEPGVPTGH